MERQQVQRANDCIPQRRRPGAVYRDHVIFRIVIKTVLQQYNCFSLLLYYYIFQ